MPFPVLQDYLIRLPHTEHAGGRVWLDEKGSAHGRYFNCTLTSAFQPVRLIDSTRENPVFGFEAFARSYSESEHGLSVWSLLEHAASDDESIALDRLCRMLHAINFYRQPEAVHSDLFLSVHDRLLTAVSSNHGIAFRRILDALGLPNEKIVLQLPAATKNQGWLLPYIADNYCRNGFRLAVNAAHAKEALTLLETVRPDFLKVDAREITDETSTLKLLSRSGDLGIRVIFKRVENKKTLETLQKLGEFCGQPIHAQGYLWDSPASTLDFNAGKTLHASAGTLFNAAAYPGVA